MLAANGSIFTILAISFERYYAICKPLEAGYKCTRFRATIIICLIWLLSITLTSPILIMAKSVETIYIDGSLVYNCILEATTYWTKMYVFITMFAFFCLPLLVLMLVYWLIGRELIRENVAMGGANETGSTKQQAAITNSNCDNQQPSLVALSIKRHINLRKASSVKSFMSSFNQNHYERASIGGGSEQAHARQLAPETKSSSLRRKFKYSKALSLDHHLAKSQNGFPFGNGTHFDSARDELDGAKKQQQSKSAWASPLLLAHKLICNLFRPISGVRSSCGQDVAAHNAIIVAKPNGQANLPANACCHNCQQHSMTAKLTEDEDDNDEDNKSKRKLIETSDSDSCSRTPFPIRSSGNRGHCQACLLGATGRPNIDPKASGGNIPAIFAVKRKSFGERRWFCKNLSLSSNTNLSNRTASTSLALTENSSSDFGQSAASDLGDSLKRAALRRGSLADAPEQHQQKPISSPKPILNYTRSHHAAGKRRTLANISSSSSASQQTPTHQVSFSSSVSCATKTTISSSSPYSSAASSSGSSKSSSPDALLDAAAARRQHQARLEAAANENYYADERSYLHNVVQDDDRADNVNNNDMNNDGDDDEHQRNNQKRTLMVQEDDGAVGLSNATNYGVASKRILLTTFEEGYSLPEEQPDAMNCDKNGRLAGFGRHLDRYGKVEGKLSTSSSSSLSNTTNNNIQNHHNFNFYHPKRFQSNRRCGSQPIVCAGQHPASGYELKIVQDLSKKQQMESRRQVVVMLAFVVTCFFLLFFPYRVFTIWLILSTEDQVQSLGMETYYNLTYFSRILIYLHSAINPIAYNLISTRFRKAFKSILLCRGKSSSRRDFVTDHRLINQHQPSNQSQQQQQFASRRMSRGDYNNNNNTNNFGIQHHQQSCKVANR